MRSIKFSLITTSLFLLMTQFAYAGPLNNVGNALENVGKSVGDTAKSVGETVGNTAEKISGDVDPVKARKEVDLMASQSLSRLLKIDRKAKALYDISYGYAVFDSRKTSFLITVGRGAGVAIDKTTKARTYMQMAAAGANIGAGLKFFQNIFLFENKEALNRFINNGWEAGTSGGGTFGRKSLESEVRFTNGMALFQLTDNGIMLSADITGTKYWKDNDLN